MHCSRTFCARRSQRSIRSALEDAADEVQRRRRLVRRALIGVSGALVALAALLLGGPR
jgi:exopolyphosphatase/pppGpp-phosphohydrolase